MSVYDYLLSELDSMPEGWRIAFGEQMCREIADALERDGEPEKYRILQIKEKFGELCWYDCNSTGHIRHVIIPKYTRLSRRTCINCGASAEWQSTDWISPWCSKCKDTLAPPYETFTPLTDEEWYR